jgi:Putative transposase
MPLYPSLFRLRNFDCKSASSDRVSSGCRGRHRSHRHGPLNVRTLGCQAGGRGLGSRRSRHFRIVFRKDWVVYAKRPFGGPQHVLRYLGRYTRRVAISNHRLVSFADGKVTFRWRDSVHNNEQKLLTLASCR